MNTKLLLTIISVAASLSLSAQCFVYSANGSVGPCESDYTYTFQGEIMFQNSPATGTLIIEIDNGTTIFTQSMPAPFTDDTPTTFIVNGIPTDGAATTVTYYFSADPACSIDGTPYNAPFCECTVGVGTYTPLVAGQSTDPYKLCFGDVLTITDNGDQIPPSQAQTSPYTYDPGYAWLVYSCPPTIALTPSETADPADDPCMVLQSGGNPGLLMIGELTEVNNGYWETNYPGVFTDNIVYLVPITMYSEVDLIYSYTNTPIGCYEIGTPFAVQYLPEITYTVVTDCALETVTATISGGSPEVNGTDFNVIAGSLTPVGAVFVNTSCADGGDIKVDNVPAGSAYSFQVEDDNGCAITISGTMDGAGSADISYAEDEYCLNGVNPTPTVTGLQGGTFSSAASLSINAANGTVDLTASNPGTYTITYSAGGGICPATATFQLTVNDLPAVNGGPDQVICTGSQAILTGSGAQSYTWNDGVTNNVAFTPLTTQTYTVTGTDANGCQNTDDVLITLTPPETVDFTVENGDGCSPVNAAFTAVTQGPNCVWQFSDGTTVTSPDCSPVTHIFTNPGSYSATLTMMNAAGCVSTGTQTGVVQVYPNPVAAFTPTPNILTLTEPVSEMVNNSTGAISYVWTFGDGTGSTVFSPTHEFPSEEGGNYSVTLVATSAGGCVDETTIIIVVREDVIYYIPNTFTPDGDEFNQNFQPVFATGIDIYNFKMYVFNRWGEIVFETNDPARGWDGTYAEKRVQDGAYTWKIEYKLLDFDDRRILVGHVNVIR